MQGIGFLVFFFLLIQIWESVNCLINDMSRHSNRRTVGKHEAAVCGAEAGQLQKVNKCVDHLCGKSD